MVKLFGKGLFGFKILYISINHIKQNPLGAGIHFLDIYKICADL
jgi:hypothetical protein